MDKPAFTVERIGESSNAVIVNLFEYYLHDMAEWFLFDTGDDGRFGYDMSPHWQRGDEAYLLRCAGKLAGFALVTSAKPWLNTDGYDVEEFFVIRRYRHTGAGDVLAKAIWAMHPAQQWLVRVYEGNVPAIPFWRKIISRYANDRQIEERRIVNGKAWSFFHFKSGTS